MREPHYWKKAGRTTAPQEIVVFDCEAWHGEQTKIADGELQTFRLACAVGYRYEKGRRTRITKLQTTKREEVWPFIESRLTRQRPVWVFAHNTPYDVGIAGLWRFILSPLFACSKCVLSATTTWIDGLWNGKRIVLSDTANYLKMPLSAIGQAVGLKKKEMPEQSADDSAWFAYCMNDVEITARAVDSLIDFVRHEDIGRWQPTAAGMAFQALRKKFFPEKVFVHCDWDVLALERDAYYGGIVETNFVGKTDIGPITECDVTSMYPSVCMNPLPVRLVESSSRMTLERMRAKMSKLQAIADVTVKTDKETYPCRRKGKVYHALGRYRTALPDPELRLAIERGHVECVHFAAFYESSSIFAPYMNHFFQRRKQYKESVNPAFAEFCKLLMNSLYGKTGQRSPRWIPWGEDSLRIVEHENGLKPGTLKVWYDWPPETDKTEWLHVWPSLGIGVDLRQYWGQVEIDCGYSESRDSCPAIAATVTSYARCLLRSYQRIAQGRGWVYSDTDSVWTTREGLRYLQEAGAIATGVIGKLEVKGQYDYVIVHGPKDYETPTASRVSYAMDASDGDTTPPNAPTSVKCKGIKKNAVKGERKMFKQLQFPSALAQIKNPTPDGVLVKYIEKDVYRKIDRCIVGPDGWTTPLTMEE